MPLTVRAPSFYNKEFLRFTRVKRYHWFMNKTSRIKTLAGMMDRGTTAALPNPLDASDVVSEAMQVRTPASSISGAQSQSSRLPARPAWKNIFFSLRNHDFLFLWLGMVIMMGGMSMQMIARGYLVYDITGSASLLGVVSVGSAVPLLVFSLFGGALADRVDRRLLIWAGQAVAVLLAVTVAVMIFTGSIEWYHLLVTSMVQGSVFAFMIPAKQALVPQLVGKGELTNALALSAAGISATTLISPAIAGGLYAWAGPGAVYLTVAGLGLMAVVLSSFIRRPDETLPERKSPIVRDIRSGLKYLQRSPILILLILISLVTSLLAMPFQSLMPVFIVDVYHRGPESMGFMVAIMASGSLAGSLSIAAFGARKRGRILLAGSFVSGAALALIAIFPFYYAAAVIMVLLGIGDSVRRTLNHSLIMEVTEDGYRGRVMSVFMMTSGLIPLAVLPVGILVDAIGAQAVIGMLAVGLLVVTTVLTLTQSRLRAMD